MRASSMGIAIALAAILTSCMTSPLPSEQTEIPSVPTDVPAFTLSSTPTLLLTVTPPNCLDMLLGGFGEVWRNEQVYPRLGCAVAPAEAVTGSEAYLGCGHDTMHSIWLSEKHLFVVVQDSRSQWVFVSDESGLSPSVLLMEEPVPRSQSCFEATGRHGWLAHHSPWAEQSRGLSRTSETPFRGAMQQFEGGWLLWNGNVCFVLFGDGTWTMF